MLPDVSRCEVVSRRIQRDFENCRCPDKRRVVKTTIQSRQGAALLTRGAHQRAGLSSQESSTCVRVKVAMKRGSKQSRIVEGRPLLTQQQCGKHKRDTGKNFFQKRKEAASDPSIAPSTMGQHSTMGVHPRHAPAVQHHCRACRRECRPSVRHLRWSALRHSQQHCPCSSPRL